MVWNRQKLYQINEKRWFEIAESYMKSIVLIQHDMQVRDGRLQVLAKPSRLQVTIPTKAESRHLLCSRSDGRQFSPSSDNRTKAEWRHLLCSIFYYPDGSNDTLTLTSSIRNSVRCNAKMLAVAQRLPRYGARRRRRLVEFSENTP